MEWKIGEIFEFGGEWYQCVEGRCRDCYFSEKRFLCKQFITKDFCASGIIFKKLEKVGEPFYSKYYGKFYQMYKTHIPAVGCNFKIRVTPVEYVGRNEIFIEIKETKEDMEEKKLNLKPFDIQKAREGKPVYTRDGRKARIICFDKQGSCPIIALVETFVKEYDCIREDSYYYTIDGRAIDQNTESKDDLMMLPEKKEGWVNVYYNRTDGITFSKHPYPSKEEAIKNVGTMSNRIDTVKIIWED